MPSDLRQVLTVSQMQAAEAVLIEGGSSVDALMQAAGRGAADLVWRIAGGDPVTVLCGPGNNGGDGYVIAEALRERGGHVSLLAAAEPKTAAARNARALYRGDVLPLEAEPGGGVFVDCLFGSGSSRPLEGAHLAMLSRLAQSHRLSVAIDLPSGVEADGGALLNHGLPRFDVTIALGAWKFAHFLMPAAAHAGSLQLVDIGIAPVSGAAGAIARPVLRPPAADAHKYRRGLLGVVGGVMPGAALLACQAAQGAGAGYVKLFSNLVACPPADLVVSDAPLAEAIVDPRIAALLIGPGLGRDQAAAGRLEAALAAGCPLVLDADALWLLSGAPRGPAVATPHAGEFVRLEQAFGLVGTGSKPERALALARASGMVVVAKGPDTVIAAPDGRAACAPRASSWLSVAGTGDVLAGIIASRMAAGEDPLAAACQGVWLHREAARLAGPAFTARLLANAVPRALADCL